jgi:lipoprotein-releasing system ATP-binding protein
MNNLTPVLSLQDLRRAFTQGSETLEILKGISLELNPGEIVALVGPSGSGKSTLLQLAGLLDQPTSGKIAINGTPAENLNDKERTALRRNDIGFVYQFHHLLPDFTALENVIMPQIINGTRIKEAQANAHKLIDQMGLSSRVTHRPSQLSGGEQQRIAIARALANSPGLLLADEPTGNLDTKTAAMVFGELVKMVKELNVGALIATHNPELAGQMDRTIVLVDGRISS